jgi:hypothetical protein
MSALGGWLKKGSLALKQLKMDNRPEFESKSLLLTLSPPSSALMYCGKSGQDIFIKDSDQIFLLERIWSID